MIKIIPASFSPSSIICFDTWWSSFLLARHSCPWNDDFWEEGSRKVWGGCENFEGINFNDDISSSSCWMMSSVQESCKFGRKKFTEIFLIFKNYFTLYKFYFEIFCIPSSSSSSPISGQSSLLRYLFKKSGDDMALGLKRLSVAPREIFSLLSWLSYN